ncbi:MAG: DUF692 family protein [Myxococcales bacterium]|nr:DUF692 family protein [Myxococcales bacterium]
MRASGTSPTGVGLGLRWAFIDEVAAGRAPESIRFFEVSPENYMRRGGAIPRALDLVAERYPILTHGLMMNVGGTTELDPAYLEELRRFCERMSSPFHSDHLCWTGSDGAILQDLLPLPHDEATIVRCVDQIARIQDALGRPFAVENISYYLVPGGGLPEAEFITEVVERSGCGLLLDVNNVAVNADNHGFDPLELIRSLPLSRVVQLHVAGGERRPHLDDLIIDTHGTDVSPRVEQLMAWVIERLGPLPVIYERDHDIPPLPELGRQVARLQEVYDEALARFEGTRPPDPERERSRVPGIGSLMGIQRGMSRIILDREAEQELPRDAATWLRQQGVRHPDHETMAELGPPRLLVYRSLVRAGLRSVIRAFLPRTMARLGEDAFERSFDDWLHEAAPRSRFLRDVPAEFVRWAASSWPHDPELPDYLVDLARLEVLEAEVDAAPDPPPPEGMVDALVLDRPLVWNGALALARFAHAVHELPTALDDRSEPTREPTRLLVYRDAEHEVRTLVLSPLAAEVLRRLVDQGATVQQAIPEGAVAADETVDGEVLGRLSALLADLAERGVLRGSTPG